MAGNSEHWWSLRQRGGAGNFEQKHPSFSGNEDKGERQGTQSKKMPASVVMEAKKSGRELKEETPDPEWLLRQ